MEGVDRGVGWWDGLADVEMAIAGLEYLAQLRGGSLFSRQYLVKLVFFLSMSLRFIVVELGTFSPKVLVILECTDLWMAALYSHAARSRPN